MKWFETRLDWFIQNMNSVYDMKSWNVKNDPYGEWQNMVNKLQCKIPENSKQKKLKTKITCINGGKLDNKYFGSVKNFSISGMSSFQNWRFATFSIFEMRRIKNDHKMSLLYEFNCNQTCSMKCLPFVARFNRGQHHRVSEKIDILLYLNYSHFAIHNKLHRASVHSILIFWLHRIFVWESSEFVYN